MLSVDQVFVMYDRSEQLLRYAMSNKIGDISGEGSSRSSIHFGKSIKNEVPQIKMK